MSSTVSSDSNMDTVIKSSPWKNANTMFKPTCQPSTANNYFSNDSNTDASKLKHIIQRQFKPVLCVTSDLPLDKVLQIMYEEHVHHLPVVKLAKTLEQNEDKTDVQSSSSGGKGARRKSTGSLKYCITGEKLKGSELIGIISERDIRMVCQSPFLGINAPKTPSDIEHKLKSLPQPPSTKTHQDSKTEQKEKVITKQEVVEQLMNKLSHHTVNEAMSRTIITIEEDASVVEGAKLMRVANIGCCPVVAKDNGNQIVAIVTRSDLLDHLIRTYEPLVQDKDESNA